MIKFIICRNSIGISIKFGPSLFVTMLTSSHITCIIFHSFVHSFIHSIYQTMNTNKHTTLFFAVFFKTSSSYRKKNQLTHTHFCTYFCIEEGYEFKRNVVIHFNVKWTAINGEFRSFTRWEILLKLSIWAIHLDYMAKRHYARMEKISLSYSSH